MKASEKALVRAGLISVFQLLSQGEISKQRNLTTIADFLLTNDYLSDKFFTEALNNEGE